MTPGRGAGANTALRDAVLLSHALLDAQQGRKTLTRAIGEYEAEMLRYSSEAVIESRKQMNSNDRIHKPFAGRLQLAAFRGAMRSIDAIPPLKRRVLQNIMRVRGQN
jgi:2-polyprenyl-6-methoxyphenol hydroxylase-like FAD-dependent oxidoreductase